MPSTRDVIKWPFRVTWQWLLNIYAVLDQFSIEDFIPTWMWEQFWETWDWVSAQVPNAAGYHATAYEQMVASVVLAGAMIVFSLTLLTYLAVIMIPPFVIGAARLHPTVDRAWPLADTDGTEPV